MPWKMVWAELRLVQASRFFVFFNFLEPVIISYLTGQSPATSISSRLDDPWSVAIVFWKADRIPRLMFTTQTSSSVGGQTDSILPSTNAKDNGLACKSHQQQ